MDTKHDNANAVRHLTADELAARLSIDRWAVWQLARTGAIRALRIGRRVRFRVVDVEAWEAAGGSPPVRVKGKGKAKRGVR